MWWFGYPYAGATSGFGLTEGAIAAWLPLFLFVVLFGLSMDYHVFILTASARHSIAD